MPRLKRPYIPLAVRCLVAERQLHQFGLGKAVATMRGMPTLKGRLELGLKFLFTEDDKPHLDHQPALCLRNFNKWTGMFTPDANDPDYLVYRSALGHKVKTLVRGDRGQYSDRALLKRKRRRMKKDLAIHDQLGAALRRWSAPPAPKLRTIKVRARKMREAVDRTAKDLEEATRKWRWPKRRLRSRSTWPKRK